MVAQNVEPTSATGSADEQPRGPFQRGRRGTRAVPRRSDAAPTAPRAEKPAKTDAQLTEALVQLYTFAGMAVSPFDQVCGTAVVNSAQPCAESLVTLAKENENVRKALIALTQTSAWGGVIAAHLPLIMAVAGHHFGDKMRGINTPDDPPQDIPPNVRHIGANGGAVGRFCPKCSGALARGVKHTCPNGA